VAKPQSRGGLVIHRILAVLVPALALALECRAQITVQPNVQVSQARANLTQGELMAASDPKRSGHLIACSLIYGSEHPDTQRGDSWGVAVYLSEDGGKTWRPTLEEHPLMDPACTYGADGTAYVMAFPLDDSGAMRIYRSLDGGRVWEPPTAIRGMDRPYFTVDGTGGKYNGNLYVYGQISSASPMDGKGHLSGTKLYTSKDSGRTFGDPVQREAGPENEVMTNSNGVVLSDGTLVILFEENRHTWDADSETDGVVEFPENRQYHPTSHLRIVTSSDGGRRLSPATTIAEYYSHIYPWRPPASIIPWIAVDASPGPFKDRLYVVWSDRRSGRDEILFSTSSDRGKNWSTPVPVNDDRSPAVAGHGPDHHLPVIAVNSRGVVGVAWYDRRDIPDNLGWNIRFRASLDGGDTWLPSVKVSEAPHSYTAKTQWPIIASSGGGWPPAVGRASIDLNINSMMIMGGDTSGMAVDSDGTFHPVWVDNRTNVPQLWTSAISVAGDVHPNGDAELAKLRDVSERLSFQFTDAAYDRAANTITVEACIKNNSKDSISGPFVIRVANISSVLGMAQIANADNHIEGPGAIWRFAMTAPDGVLPPDALSEARELKFHLTDVRSFAATIAGYSSSRGAQDSMGLVHLDLRILAPVAKP
jgi:hypothetical protein